jgi:hypothetical protein
MARLTEHDFGTCGSATGRVCCEILRPHVGLGLDDAPYAQRAAIIVHEVHAYEVTGYSKRAWGVEVAGKFAGSIHEPASYSVLGYFGTAVSAWATRTSFFTLFTPGTERMSASASLASVDDLATPVKITWP